MNRRRKLGAFLLLCSALGAGLLWKLDAGSASTDVLVQWLAVLAVRPEAPWLAFIAVALGGFIVFPVAPALLFAGALLGNQAYVIALGGMLFSCSIVYWIGRKFGGQSPSEAAESGKMSALIQKHGALASVLSRLIPGIPFSLQNLMLGSARVPWWTYLAGSVIGAGIVTFVFVSAGMAGAQALTQFQNAIQYGWIVPAVGALAGIVLLLATPASLPT